MVSIQSNVVKKIPFDANFMSPPNSIASMVVFVATGVAESSIKLPRINGFMLGIRLRKPITKIGMMSSLIPVKT